MSLLKLRLSMYGTLAFIIGASTLFFAAILTLTGSLSLLVLMPIVVIFNIIQWLFAPKLIEAMYKAKEASRSEHGRLYGMVERLSRKLNLATPKLMIARLPIPNAFAYGSPLTGSRVAVTEGLLKNLEEEEVEAVIGHELGHLKHRDVQIMMFVSVLPAIFYFLGYSLMLSTWFGGYGARRGQGAAAPFLIGIACLAIYWILSLFVLGLSRYREYYADRTSVSIVEDGARKLSEGLAKIVRFSGRMRRYQGREIGSLSSFKSLFIADPVRASRDVVELSHYSRYASDQQLVNEILSRRLTWADRFAEIFSTHPNIVKRLKALQELR
ncbi:zinc metalloprotease HtpX [Candidatus Hecatella orcuttiae]|uniref:zinc metalloprotease HtpX n=1 Tax=Candidatus Hecatella orcuttiae TaxID=1935119 RepID=UPI0028680AE2|nr:zinc metalloprotease HtpX [Candidatus Hecatella orcuttiae]